jgi:hypothetical protein
MCVGGVEVDGWRVGGWVKIWLIQENKMCCMTVAEYYILEEMIVLICFIFINLIYASSIESQSGEMYPIHQ